MPTQNILTTPEAIRAQLDHNPAQAEFMYEQAARTSAGEIPQTLVEVGVVTALAMGDFSLQGNRPQIEQRADTRRWAQRAEERLALLQLEGEYPAREHMHAAYLFAAAGDLGQAADILLGVLMTRVQATGRLHRPTLAAYGILVEHGVGHPNNYKYVITSAIAHDGANLDIANDHPLGEVRKRELTDTDLDQLHAWLTGPEFDPDDDDKPKGKPPARSRQSRGLVPKDSGP